MIEKGLLKVCGVLAASAMLASSTYGCASINELDNSKQSVEEEMQFEEGYFAKFIGSKDKKDYKIRTGPNNQSCTVSPRRNGIC